MAFSKELWYFAAPGARSYAGRRYVLYFRGRRDLWERRVGRGETAEWRRSEKGRIREIGKLRGEPNWWVLEWLKVIGFFF